MHMDGQLVWYLLAGFLLGFATSTLWEWLYYRRIRRQRAYAAPAAGGLVFAQPVETVGLVAGGTSGEPTAEHTYRSPAVFIDIEGEAEEPAEHTLTQPLYEPVAEQQSPPSEAVEPAPSAAGAPAESANV
jgi:hypothetical protein